MAELETSSIDYDSEITENNAGSVEAQNQEDSFGPVFSEFQRLQDSGGSNGQIRGTVVAVDAESVIVDIGRKSEGVLPLTAFGIKEPAKVGDTLTVSVKGRGADGYYELSLFRTVQPKDWTSLERAFTEKQTITGTVTGVVKGGLHVDVGVRAFLPASRSGTRDAAEIEKLVGQEIRCRITKFDIADEDVVIDRRAVLEEELLETKGRRFAEVQEGAILHGTVRSLADYGAFVDLGGIDGLLHVSDISWNRISKATDVLEVGQEVEVKVLKIEPENRRISLGMKQLQTHPWDAVPETFHVGDRVRGSVSRLADFGAFVELASGVEGLIHLSEMSWSKRVHKAADVVKVGDIVEAVILNINSDERRLSLGLKQALGDPWVEFSEKIEIGSVVEGAVASMTKFGAFVQVAEGVQGLVHISEISVDRRLNHPSDLLRVGQVVQAQVLEIDKEKRQLRLSMKQLVPTGLDEFLAEHKAGDTVTGRVMSVEGLSARVELGEGIVASCVLPKQTSESSETGTAQQPSSNGVDLSAFGAMLKTKWKSGPESAKPASEKARTVEVGQVLRFKIKQLDIAKKQVELEMI